MPATPRTPSPSPSQLLIRWTFRAQRASTLQTTGVFHVNPSRLLSPAAPPLPWINPATGRCII